MVERVIYMDHHATTPLDERVLEAMLPYLRGQFGNPASKSHPYGWEAADAVADARREVAALIGAQAKEIVFTSGATESDNLAILGAVRRRAIDDGKPGHVVTSAIEHKAVLDACRALEDEGFSVTVLAPNPDGRIDVEQVADAIVDDTVLVSVMHANNEVGTIQPIADIGALCRARGVTFHVDAAQSAGSLVIDVDAMCIDLLSLSAHKMYGPKGTGALYVRKKPKVSLRPLVFGGGHERGLRSGTIDVPSVVGLAAAAGIAASEGASEAARVGALRDGLLTRLQTALSGVVVHGSLEHRLAGNLNLGFECVEAEALLLRLSKRVAISSGSACTTATLEPSHVLRALGVPHDLAHSSVRFGLGRVNDASDVERVADAVILHVNELRASSEVWAARAAEGL